MGWREDEPVLSIPIHTLAFFASADPSDHPLTTRRIFSGRSPQAGFGPAKPVLDAQVGREAA
jgi:hypothetical protein